MSGYPEGFSVLPDHPKGYRESTLRKPWGLGERFEDFKMWMRGQTVAIADDGEVVYYPHDVDRYLSGGTIID